MELTHLGSKATPYCLYSISIEIKDMSVCMAQSKIQDGNIKQQQIFIDDYYEPTHILTRLKRCHTRVLNVDCTIRLSYITNFKAFIEFKRIFITI